MEEDREDLRLIAEAITTHFPSLDELSLVIGKGSWITATKGFNLDVDGDEAYLASIINIICLHSDSLRVLNVDLHKNYKRGRIAEELGKFDKCLLVIGGNHKLQTRGKMCSFVNEEDDIVWKL